MQYRFDRENVSKQTLWYHIFCYQAIQKIKLLLFCSIEHPRLKVTFVLINLVFPVFHLNLSIDRRNWLQCWYFVPNNPKIARIIVNQRDPAYAFRNIFETFRQTSLSQCKRTDERSFVLDRISGDRRKEKEERRSYLRFEIPREIVEPACTNFAIWCPSIDSSVSWRRQNEEKQLHTRRKLKFLFYDTLDSN